MYAVKQITEWRAAVVQSIGDIRATDVRISARASARLSNFKTTRLEGRVVITTMFTFGPRHPARPIGTTPRRVHLRLVRKQYVYHEIIMHVPATTSMPGAAPTTPRGRPLRPANNPLPTQHPSQRRNRRSNPRNNPFHYQRRCPRMHPHLLPRPSLRPSPQSHRHQQHGNPRQYRHIYRPRSQREFQRRPPRRFPRSPQHLCRPQHQLNHLW
mmetsp:Transcript_83106/g.161756  ORF Transcript_83106/g.161756 Transcript_83106/m.161756 type:complete len:212 (+) Transcript_83106:403-1038(+)